MSILGEHKLGTSFEGKKMNNKARNKKTTGCIDSVQSHPYSVVVIILGRENRTEKKLRGDNIISREVFFFFFEFSFKFSFCVIFITESRGDLRCRPSAFASTTFVQQSSIY